MKIIFYPLPEPTQTLTHVADDVSYGDVIFDVLDASALSVNDFVLMQERGSEYNEIVKIAAIDNNELSIPQPGVTLNHSVNILVTKINYDKYRIYSSPDNDVYTLIKEDLLDYSNKYSSIHFIDDEGNDNLFYKIYYYNSHTDTEDLQATINDNTISNISIDEFKRDSTFDSNTLNDAEISSALRAGLEWVQDNAYKTTIVETMQQDNVFTLDLSGMVFCDWNGDNSINANDMIVYEEDRQGNRYYINYLINKVLPNSNRVLFKTLVPRDDRLLVFNIKTTFKPLDEIKTTLKTIIKLIATNWILRNVDTSKIKGGITSWSAGGTNVNRDMNAVKDSVDKNYQEAQRLLHQLLKIYMQPTKLRSTYSHLNWNQRQSNFLNLGGMRRL